MRPPSPPAEWNDVEGFGLDVEPLRRWHELHDDRVAWTRLLRSFTSNELAQVERHPSGPAAGAAGRWVAKEAVVKALAARVGIREVEVLSVPGGALEVRAPTLTDRSIHVSIAYTEDHAFGAAWVGRTTIRQEAGMLRPARPDDAEMVLGWRNHPKVRELSFSPEEIDRATHQAWWASALEDPDRSVFIYERDGIPRGVVTYQREDGGAFTWAFYLDLAGLGDGPDLLAAWVEIFEEGIAMAFERLNATLLHGDVLSENRAVRALHRRFGFEEGEPYTREVNGVTRTAVHMRLTQDDRRPRRREHRTSDA